MAPKNPKQIYQIKVTLKDSHPPIWRRIQVPGNITLEKLHDILQIIMGWEDYHLHQFIIDDDYYGNPVDDETGMYPIMSEKRYKLSQLIPEEGYRFTYEYDFGDSWEHLLLVEKILLPEPGVVYPRCIKGKRACPPEDVGGVWGYEDFLETIKSPAHPEHDEMLDWVGGEFDSEAFDIDEINSELQQVGKRRAPAELEQEPLESKEAAKIIPALDRWIKQFDQEQVHILETLSLRRDTISLLTYLRDHHVTGTPSTGNFPLKAVREIAGALTNPPTLDEIVGDHVYRLRSEDQVWPIYFLHALAVDGGLIFGGMKQRWQLTPEGDKFLTAIPPAQVWFLFAVWYAQSDWTIAYPFVGLGESLPGGFKQVTLSQILALPVGEWVPFKSFADELIRAGRLRWSSPDPTFHRTALHGAVKKMIIDILANFGILEMEFTQKTIDTYTFPELGAIRVTPFGRGLLETLSNQAK